MATNKDLVEQAIIQMKNVEQAIAENAKGILQSTMKEEISQLVKESLHEQDDEEMIDVETDVDTDVDYDSDEFDDTEVDNDESDFDDEDEPIDLTDVSNEELLKVFKAMGEDDGIIVKKDGEDIHLSDNNDDVEYLLKLGESTEEYDEMDEEYDEMDEEYDEMDEEYDEMDVNEDVDDIIDAIFSNKGTSNVGIDDIEGFEDEEDEDNEELEEDDIVYEIEFDDEEDEEDDEEDDETIMYEVEFDDDEEELKDYMSESYNPKKFKKTSKPKGVGIGSGPKFSYKTNKGGFDENKKEGPKSVGTGKAKFSYKDGENLAGKNKVVKKTETKEASRTYGMGSKEGRGLRKGVTPNRNLTFEALENEVNMLRQKNEEYRKALNVFREKLNEVAIFNSNLAYATRLFTEHSTTKKEKINILRRFDNVETLKESKNLYRVIKDELSKPDTQSINENVEMKLNKPLSSGSSTTLIESTTYENPQFLRMKDLMSKLA